MAAFDFFDEDEPGDPEIVQRLESSLNFLVNEKDDNPPAIRGVMAAMGDLREDVQDVVRKISRDPDYPELDLRKLLWFDDKNGKLDEACSESKAAFGPYPVTADGLISFKDPNNPLLDKPTQHRLVVSDQFAGTNYERPSSDDMILDDDDPSVDGLVNIKENSWKRKITQTIKPWRIQKDGKIVPARDSDDLLLTLNSLFSRTKHGWLVADLIKLKKRRGSVLINAKTYEYQIKDDQRFEFKLRYFGAAKVYQKHLAKSLSRLASLYLEIDDDGEIYVTKVSDYPDGTDDPNPQAKKIELTVDARIVHENGKPSQIVLKKSGKYFEAKLLPLIQQEKKLATKIDLRKSNTDSKSFHFKLRIELDAPLLVASSGDATIFQLDDMLRRFMGTSLSEIRAKK